LVQKPSPIRGAERFCARWDSTEDQTAVFVGDRVQVKKLACTV